MYRSIRGEGILFNLIYDLYGKDKLKEIGVDFNTLIMSAIMEGKKEIVRSAFEDKAELLFQNGTEEEYNNIFGLLIRAEYSGIFEMEYPKYKDKVSQPLLLKYAVDIGLPEIFKMVIDDVEDKFPYLLLYKDFIENHKIEI